MTSSVISVFSSKGVTTFFSTFVSPLLQNEFDGLLIPNIVWKNKSFSETPKTENDPHKSVKIDLQLIGGKVDIVTLSAQKIQSQDDNIYVEFSGNTRLEYALWKENSTPTISHKSFTFAPKSDFFVKNFQFQITPLTISGNIKISLSKGAFSTTVNLAASFASVDLTPPPRSALVNFPEAEAALLKTLRANLEETFASALNKRIQASVRATLTNQLNKFIQTVSLYQNDDIKYQYDDEQFAENLKISSAGSVIFKGKSFPGQVDPVTVPVPQHDQAIAISRSVFEAVLWAGASEGLGNATITGHDLPVPDFLLVDYYVTMPDLKPFVEQYKGKEMVVDVTLPSLTAGVDKSASSLKYTAGLNLQVTIDKVEVFSAVVTQQGTVVVTPQQHTQGTSLDMSFKQGKTAVEKATTSVKDLSDAVASQFVSTMWTFGLLPTYMVKLGAIGSLGVPLPVTALSQVLGQTWNDTGVVIDVAVASSDAILHLY